MKSVVVPVYNSSDTLENLVARIEIVFGADPEALELVLVDDGSGDGSFDEIRRLAARHPIIRGFRLSRNFGHQAALMIGLQESRGEMIGILDDDLQDPPEVLALLFEEVSSGVDVAYGVRRSRKEGPVKRALFSSFYWLLKRLSHINIPRDTGDFCAMTRRMCDTMLQLYDANPFLRGFRAWVGFKQKGVEYERSSREVGESGYTMSKYFRLATTGIIMFSNLPLRVATFVGLIASTLSMLYACILVVYWFFSRFDVPGFLTIIIVITFLGGIQLLSIGIIGEYVGRLLENSRRWPVAIVGERTGDGE